MIFSTLSSNKSCLYRYTERPSNRQFSSKSGLLIFLPKLWQILSNFCFHGNVEKIIFGPLLNDKRFALYCLFALLALYRVTVRGGSDQTTFESLIFRHPKVVQKVLFWRDEQNKSCWKFNFEWFWPKKVHLGMKIDDLGWGVRSDPRRAECVGRSKTRGLGGS